MGDTAHRWQALADAAVARVSFGGAHSLTVSGARERKALMDDFRDASASLRTMVGREAAGDLERERWTAIGLVVALGTLLHGGGLLLVERAGRRDIALRRKEEEFIETLQGADDEGEAQQLLRRHVERAVPGASARLRSSRARSAATCRASPAARRRSSAAR
jgi:hypothetical protein